MKFMTKPNETINGQIESQDNREAANKYKCTAEINFDELNLGQSHFILKNTSIDILRLARTGIVFFTGDDKKFILKKRGEYVDAKGIEISFSIESLEYTECRADSFIYRSNYVENLLNDENSIEIENLEIQKKLIERDSKRYYFYELISPNDLPEIEIKKIFSLLAFITASAFFCVYKKNKEGFVHIKNRFSRKRTLTIYGSGNLMYPLNFSDLYGILSNDEIVNIFSSITFLYQRFTTADDKANQFLNGCNLLEYLIQIYIDENKTSFKEQINGHANYSNKLFFVAENLFNDIDRAYFKSLFRDYPENIEALNTDRNRNNSTNGFFFFRLRNNFVHNGKTIEVEDKNALINSIFIVNEILRMILTNFDNIVFSNREINGFEAKSMEESIRNRRSQIGK